MSRLSRSLLVIAFLTFGYGLAVFVSPELASLFSFGDDAVTVAGALSVILGLYVLNNRRSVDIGQVDLPEPETPETYTVPGDNIDDLLARIRGAGTRRARAAPRGELRNELTTLAVAVLTERQGVTRADARSMLADGTWTDDPQAAAFFIGSLPEWGKPDSRVRRLLSWGNPVWTWAEHAIAELDGLMEGDDDTGG